MKRDILVFRYGKEISESALDLMLNQDYPAIFYIQTPQRDINIMVNIAKLLHQKIKTRFKIYIPEDNLVFLGNPSNRIMTCIKQDYFVGFREQDKIGLDRRYELRGDHKDLVRMLCSDFKLVSPKEYDKFNDSNI